MIPFESPPQGALENPGKNPDEYHYPLPFENLLTTPFEIAHAVAFLLSEKSSHTTGQLFRVNGGSRTLTGS
jgi:L-fucose dehydrogenase